MQAFSIRVPFIGQLVALPGEARKGLPWFRHWRDGDAHHFQVGRWSVVYDTPATLAAHQRSHDKARHALLAELTASAAPTTFWLGADA